jgi:hypothetical protein
VLATPSIELSTPPILVGLGLVDEEVVHTGLLEPDPVVTSVEHYLLSYLGTTPLRRLQTEHFETLYRRRSSGSTDRLSLVSQPRRRRRGP